MGIARICGPAIAARWAASLLLRMGGGDHAVTTCSRPTRLWEKGHFTVRLPSFKASFRVAGPSVFSGVREMYVRDVYRRGEWVEPDADDVVVDLGANMGNFSAMALAWDPGVRVVAVEPSRSLNARFVESLGLNRGFLDRVQLIRAFIGSRGPIQEQVTAEDANYSDAEWITEDELMRRAAIRQIGLLKCDIEGSEFGLLGPRSKLLAITRVLACEVHASAGDVATFVADLQASGFGIDQIDRAPDGSVTLLARRLDGTPLRIMCGISQLRGQVTCAHD